MCNFFIIPMDKKRLIFIYGTKRKLNETKRKLKKRKLKKMKSSLTDFENKKFI